MAMLSLACLLVLPAFALHRRGVDFSRAGVYALVMAAISYGCYALDKRRARAKEWRISESALHLTELLGGWPGAFLAQRRLRHKVSKPNFQFVFWSIVLAYQFAACDSLQNWRFSRAALEYLERTAKHTEAPPDAAAPLRRISRPEAV